MTSTLHLGDCLEVLRTMADASVDAVVTDPPYGLSFMGKKWDYDVPSVAIWAECLRVLKPGGHLLAFAGTRTQHRMAVRIEDAGFEIRDMIAWVYGQGFPKSLDVSKAIDRAAGAEREVVGVKPGHEQFANRSTSGHLQADEDVGEHRFSMKDEAQARYHQQTAPATPEAQQWAGWGTALKPALEPITMARKPLEGTVAANVLEHGTGALNVDGCRVGVAPADAKAMERANSPLSGRMKAGRTPIGAFGRFTPTGAMDTTAGRWPANLIHDGSDEVVGLFPAEARSSCGGGKAANAKPGYSGGFRPDHDSSANQYFDTGSAARFFKQCKGYTEAWPNVPPEPANTAGNCSSQQRQSVASALSDAATWALQGAICSSVSLAPSMSATGSELRQLCESVTTAIQSIGPRFWHESEPARLSLKLSHASFAVQREPTGITTITASHWKSDGSADPVTFSIIGMSTAAGGQASVPRAFYTSKASRDDRDPGNTHPTVKPTDLMRYLCRLVTPPGGIVLDPFAGSGSTGKAAELEGFDSILIEQDPASYAIAKQRISRAQAAGHQPDLFASAGPVA
jgi:predicted RNA methylase